MPPKRKIALFSTSFLAYSQTFIYDEITSHSPDYEIEVFCKSRMNEDRFPFENYHNPKGKVAEYVYQNMAYSPSFNRIIKKGNFDLIHAHFGTGAVYALPYVKKFDLPFVVTFWGNDVSALIGKQRYDPNRWRYILKAPEILERADIVLAVSNEMKQILSEIADVEHKTRLYHQGIDLTNFSPGSFSNEGPVNILLIGRFTQKKGHIVALKAFKKVLDSGKKATLTFIGDGELMETCQNYVQQNNIGDHVNFAGVMTQKEIAEYLKNTDMLLVPSIVADDHDREGSPTVIREASASGIPVIGTYHAGIWECIEDGKTGFLVAERDINTLADRIMTLIDDPELRSEMGKNARIKMENEFNLQKQVALLESYYEEAIHRK